MCGRSMQKVVKDLKGGVILRVPGAEIWGGIF